MYSVTAKFFKIHTPIWKRCLASHTQCQEIKIPLQWGHIGGKWWGPTDQRPILCMHGWQDNCGTFNRLIPLLDPNASFLAIDFPGHGLSSRIPSGLFYHNIDNLIVVQEIVDYFKWSKVSLMGHSLGGIVSYIYGMTYPKNVELLICLDGAKPMVKTDAVVKIAKQIQRGIKYLALEANSKEPPSYTMDQIRQKISSVANNSIALEYSDHLIERNVSPSKLHPGKYYFTRDIRLKTGELLHWAQEDTMEASKFMTFPILIAKAISGSYYETKKNFYDVLDVLKESSIDCQYHRLEGTHHLHLNNPELLSKLVNDFIQKYYSIDQSGGGIREEIQICS